MLPGFFFALRGLRGPGGDELAVLSEARERLLGREL